MLTASQVVAMQVLLVILSVGVGMAIEHCRQSDVGLWDVLSGGEGA